MSNFYGIDQQHTDRLLSPKQFAELHLAHHLAHPPDSILFPFLHGLEASNSAQNLFFAEASQTRYPHPTLMLQDKRGRAIRPPKYRGLVWVLCEEDIRPDLESDEDWESDIADNEAPQSPMLVDAHMHPVNHRPSPLKITTITNPDSNTKEVHILNQHDRRDSSASSASSASIRSSCPSSVSTSATSPLPSPTSPPPTLCSPFIIPSQAAIPPPNIQPPTLLTSTLHPTELIRPVLDLTTACFSRFHRTNHFSDLSTDLPQKSPTGPDDTMQVDGDHKPSGPEYEFVPPRVPDGISLRNFGIQVPIYASVSDIVIYSPRGNSPATQSLARRFESAIEKKYQERVARLRAHHEALGQPDPDVNEGLLRYNVFILDADAATIERELPHLVVRRDDNKQSCCTAHGGAHTEGTDGRTSSDPFSKVNTIDFAQREKQEMRDLTKASEIISLFPEKWEPPAGACLGDLPSQNLTLAQARVAISASTPATFWDQNIGQVFLGNAGDVPIVRTKKRKTGSKLAALEGELDLESSGSSEDESGRGTHAPDPFAYIPSNTSETGMGYDICIECHELAPFPTAGHLRAAEEHIWALEAMWRDRVKRGADDDEGAIPPRPPPHASSVIHLPFPSSPPSTAASLSAIIPVIRFLERMLRPPQTTNRTNVVNGINGPQPRLTPTTNARHMFHALPNPYSPSPYSRSIRPAPPYLARPSQPRISRPIKILLYSADGYTESSVLALCLLMAVRALSLPEAYLELQVDKRRSFFVYQSEVGVLKKVEGKLGVAGGNAPALGVNPTILPPQNPFLSSPSAVGPNGLRPLLANPAATSCVAVPQRQPPPSTPTPSSSVPTDSFMPTFVTSPTSSSVPTPVPTPTPSRRRRASTSPWLPSFIANHQVWFDDPRFDGSFPSRVLPFLYLGNLNHASNAYMLHALGITHVVSVGECALVPPLHTSDPPSLACSRPTPGAHFVAGKGPDGQGSLWIEEREGRIKVLDIKGVCDDGIDTLEPQLQPICDWIEKARLEGGQVLVHCRVGVSRSATVTIAYVMKYLNLPLVDAYLIVRSRRLSVLIQPNMRLLYNLLGWEVKLARERAGGDDEKLKVELTKALSWPYLAREVHALNEKYLH